MRNPVYGRKRPVFVVSLIFVLALASLPGFAASVVAVDPPAQSIAAPATGQCVITFDEPLNFQTVTAASFRVFGRWSGPVPGTIQPELDGRRLRFLPSRPFFAGEWVTVALARTIQTAAGDPLPQGYTWNFWIRTAPGTLDPSLLATVSIRRDQEPHIQSYGGYAGDLNGDGWSDLAIPNEKSNDVRVFLNQGGMFDGFEIHPLPSGATPSTNEGADFDLDGDIDFAVGNIDNDKVSVLHGDGAGGFLPEVTYEADFDVRGLAVLDCDGDGYDDIVTAQRTSNSMALLRNQGDGTFAAPVPFDANSVGETACAVADANGDGLQDLFVGAYGSQELVLMLGDGEGGFTFSDKVPAGPGVGGWPWMLAVGDVSGDGHADVVAANSVAGNVSVCLGDGQGGLGEPQVYFTGAFPLAIDLGDLDGDGDLDLVSSNYSGNNWTIYENTGAGQFSNRRDLPASSAGSCALLHDRDNDGDLDITGIDEDDDLLFLFDNDPGPVAAPSRSVASARVARVYPNPFNPRVTIELQLPRAGRVEAQIHDLRGARIATLLRDDLPAGSRRLVWDGRDAAGRPVASGVYTLRVVGSASVETRKLVLAR